MYGMKKNKKMMNKGGNSFKDFNNDGKITQADILMGRGVKLKKKMMDGGMMPKKKKMMDGGMMPKKKKMMGGGMMYGKKKMMDGGNVSKGGNERLYPYGKTNLLG